MESKRRKKEGDNSEDLAYDMTFYEMEDSSSMYREQESSSEELLFDLLNNGYIFIRNFFSRDKVLLARDYVRSSLNEHYNIDIEELENTNNIDELSKIQLLDKPQIAHSDLVMDILESKDLFNLFYDLFQQEFVSFDYKVSLIIRLLLI